MNKVRTLMKLVLFAHQNWGVKGIESILKTSHKILHVYTHPKNYDKYEKEWYKSVFDTCKKYNISVEERLTSTKDDANKIKKLKPDLIMSLGWRRLIPKSIFQIPKYGTLNLHDSLLPKYGGFAPINWAIINGESEIGVTMHFVDEGIDSGNILLQRKISVKPDDTVYDVYKKALKQTDFLVQKSLELVQSQNQITKKTTDKGFTCSRRFPDDGRIDWYDDRLTVYNFIRALSPPYPSSFCFYKNKKIFIHYAKLTKCDYRGSPGCICKISDKGIIVTCGKNHTTNQGLLITEVFDGEKILKPNIIFQELWEKLD